MKTQYELALKMAQALGWYWTWYEYQQAFPNDPRPRDENWPVKTMFDMMWSYLDVKDRTTT